MLEMVYVGDIFEILVTDSEIQKVTNITVAILYPSSVTYGSIRLEKVSFVIRNELTSLLSRPRPPIA